jgi:hypothetical protein
MFNVAVPTFTRIVEVFTPDDDGHRKETVTATFRVVPTDEAARIKLATEDGTSQFLRRAIVRLDDLADAGRPVAYGDEVRDQVLRMPHARIALVNAYFDAVSKAKEGN